MDFYELKNKYFSLVRKKIVSAGRKPPFRAG